MSLDVLTPRLLNVWRHVETDSGPGVCVAEPADFVGEVDAVQYGIGEGPCITAARDGVTVICSQSSMMTA